MKRKRKPARTKLFAQITENAIAVFGGTHISLLNPQYGGDEELREIDLSVYLLVLCHSAGGNLDFFAAPATLAKTLRRDVATIRRSITRLQDAGFIEKIGYRIAHKRTNSGFTVKTWKEGRAAIENGDGLCFSTRVYKVLSPEEYLMELRAKVSDLSDILKQATDYNFRKRPEDFGIKTQKLKLKLKKPKVVRMDATGTLLKH